MNNDNSIKGLVDTLRDSGINFGYVVRQNGGLITSDKKLDPLCDLIESLEDFNEHEAVFVGIDSDFPTVFFAFVHNTNRGLSQGGLRFTGYGDNLSSVLTDGLRLSQGMSRKNAVSGLWWGGGKGVIPVTEELMEETFGGNIKNQSKRDELFAAYGKFVAKLNGVYYTAADIGTYGTDMKAVLTSNRFVTCIPMELGGSGDPSPHTAEGVFRAIKAIVGENDLSGLSVAVQGAGKVGKPLIEKLTNAGAKVFVSDISFETNEDIVKEFVMEFPDAEIVPMGEGHENDIFALDVNIIAPCARGSVINQETIALIKPTVKIICGGANNILGNENKDGETLYQKGITYIPDFVCNWMGIVNCANEAFGYLEEDVKEQLENVSPTVKLILKTAKEKNISHTEASHLLADEKIKEIPPLELLINRGRRLIQKIIEANN
jgi:leucine dehydrogenase